MFTLAFWRATFERAISTAAQAALALLSADGLGVLDVNWRQIGSVVGLAAALAVLKALAAAGIGNAGPGFGDAETLTPAVAAEAAPASPSGLVAGPAADVPEGEPVNVTPAELPAGDYIAEGFLTDPSAPPLPKPNDPDKGGYWGGV